jgi:hypothetical protein
MGQVAKATSELFPEIVAQVRSKRTLPAAEPPEGDAEVVKRLIVGLARQAGMGRVRVGQLAERYQSDRSISRFAKIVDSRRHSRGNRESGIGNRNCGQARVGTESNCRAARVGTQDDEGAR